MSFSTGKIFSENIETNVEKINRLMHSADEMGDDPHLTSCVPSFTVSDWENWDWINMNSDPLEYPDRFQKKEKVLLESHEVNAKIIQVLDANVEKENWPHLRETLVDLLVTREQHYVTLDIESLIDDVYGHLETLRNKEVLSDVFQIETETMPTGGPEFMLATRFLDFMKDLDIRGIYSPRVDWLNFTSVILYGVERAVMAGAPFPAKDLWCEDSACCDVEQCGDAMHIARNILSNREDLVSVLVHSDEHDISLIKEAQNSDAFVDFLREYLPNLGYFNACSDPLKLRDVANRMNDTQQRDKMWYRVASLLNSILKISLFLGYVSYADRVIFCFCAYSKELWPFIPNAKKEGILPRLLATSTGSIALRVFRCLGSYFRTTNISKDELRLLLSKRLDKEFDFELNLVTARAQEDIFYCLQVIHNVDSGVLPRHFTPEMMSRMWEQLTLCEGQHGGSFKFKLLFLTNFHLKLIDKWMRKGRRKNATVTLHEIMWEFLNALPDTNILVPHIEFLLERSWSPMFTLVKDGTLRYGCALRIMRENVKRLSEKHVLLKKRVSAIFRQRLEECLNTRNHTHFTRRKRQKV